MPRPTPGVTLLGVVVLVATTACSDPPPSGPAQTCTSYQSEVGDLADGGPEAAADGSSGAVPGHAPICIPLAASSTDGGLSCAVFATLRGSGAESACAPLGLTAPATDLLTQIRANQESEWSRAGGADGGGVDWSAFATCQVPSLPGMDGECATSPGAGWCLATGAAAGGCESAVVLSPGGDPTGALLTIDCEACGN